MRDYVTLLAQFRSPACPSTPAAELPQVLKILLTLQPRGA